MRDVLLDFRSHAGSLAFAILASATLSPSPQIQAEEIREQELPSIAALDRLIEDLEQRRRRVPGWIYNSRWQPIIAGLKAKAEIIAPATIKGGLACTS